MGLLSLVHAPGRYANLRRIRSLDPEVDHDELDRVPGMANGYGAP